jgi:hypothetical protein
MTSPLPLFPEATRCYKTRPDPPSPQPLCLFFFPTTPSRRRTLLAGIRRDLSTPPKFPRPTASPPPPLATRPDPVQPRPPLRRNCAHLEPPLAGATRARPHRRQLPPLDLRLIQVLSTTPHLPLVLMRVLDPHVRRPFTGNGDVPPRPPHLSVAGHVPLLPVKHPKLSLGIHRSCQTSPSPPAPPARTHRGRSAGRRRGLAGAFVQIEILFQGPQRKNTKTPPICVVIL